jgi:hypothetical protein
MNYIDDYSLGGQLNPINNNIELTKAMKGRRNCYLYTFGTFEVNEVNLFLLKTNNIKLVGGLVARAKNKAKEEAIVGTENKKIIIFDELSFDVKMEYKEKYIGGMH